MKVDLSIKTASYVASANKCPAYTQVHCGIMYRSNV